MLETLPKLRDTDFPALNRDILTTLQINLGYRCNQQCLHCHVNAGPNRKEIMQLEVIDDIIAFIDNANITTIDLTGGAPELNPHFRYLVTEARRRNLHVIDRCNLTILLEPGQDDLADFLTAHQVEVVASLPCYSADNVDSQRGKGVFNGSIAGLQRLNSLGYANPGSGLLVNLVYNPLGPYLPPPQQALEQDYKKRLADQFDIQFNNLYTLANMPIQRFGSTLLSKGQFDDYMKLLRDAHQDSNLQQVMCRNMISIDWQGYLYDCDFNQMLKLPIAIEGKPKLHISELEVSTLDKHPIAVLDHCYGCTAGQGSSCGGALAE